MFTISRIQPWWLVLFFRCFVFMLFCALFNNPTKANSGLVIVQTEQIYYVSFSFIRLFNCISSTSVMISKNIGCLNSSCSTLIYFS